MMICTFFENLDPEEKVTADIKVGDEVKIEKNESLGLDDCSIGLEQISRNVYH